MDERVATGRWRALSPSLVGGAVSGALYLSVALSFVFLLPLQVAFSRSGRRGGLVAAAASAVVATVGLVWRIVRLAGLAEVAVPGPLALAAGILPPLALVAGLVLVNLAFPERVAPLWRVLAVTGLIALLAAPAMAALASDKDFTAYLADRLQAVIAPAATDPGAAAGDYESAALRASFDPAELAASSLATLASSYAAFLLALIGGSRWFGSRAVARSEGRDDGALSLFRAPPGLLWPALAAWAALAAALLLGAPPLARAAAWNLALVAALVYGAQGLGIVSFFLDRIRAPRLARFALGAAALAAALSTPVGTAAAAALPLLGFSEVWIPYRNLKGVGS